MFYNIAKEIWDATKSTFSDKENTSKLFEIESKLCDWRQGDKTGTHYFNTMTHYTGSNLTCLTLSGSVLMMRFNIGGL